MHASSVPYYYTVRLGQGLSAPLVIPAAVALFLTQLLSIQLANQKIFTKVARHHSFAVYSFMGFVS